MEDRIIIGKIVKPQGVKGEVKIMPLTQDNNRFLDLEWVFCKDDTFHIRSCDIRKDYVYLSFEEFNNRNDVEKLRNQYLSLPKEMAIALPEDTWFITDLIGCLVETEDGTSLGELKDVLQNGSIDVYVTQKLMFPALKRVLKSVDIAAKKIIVDKVKLDEVAVYED